MDTKLFEKYIHIVTKKNKDKEKVLSLALEKCNISLHEEILEIKGKNITFLVSSTIKNIYKMKGLFSLLEENGYTVR